LNGLADIFHENRAKGSSGNKCRKMAQLFDYWQGVRRAHTLSGL